MTTAASSEPQQNFGKHLQIVQTEGEATISFLTDSLIGILKKDYDDKMITQERMQKYF